MRARVALALAFASALGACSPTFDWREARPPGSQAQLMFPCRPASQVRRVTLAGASVEMTMVACSAADTVFALSFTDLRDPALVGAALDELAGAARSRLRSPDGGASTPFAVPGMTPHSRIAQWRLAGLLPDGRAVQQRAVLFNHGTLVYQATMLGPGLDVEAQETFFGSLRVGT